MSNDKKASQKEEPKKSEPTKKAYTLKIPVYFDGKLKKAGEKVMLTEKAKAEFKRKHRI